MLGTGTILNNQTTISTTSLAVATHPITAVYGGDTNFNGATSAELSQVVGNATLTVTANNTTRPFGEPNPEFTVTITGFVNGDPPSVVSGTPGFSTPATSSSPVGEYPIEVTEDSLAAANYDFTFVPGTLLITSITPTITLTSSPNPSFFGNAVTFTATVPAAATGTVSFLDGTTTLDMVTITGNTVTFTTSALAAGIHSIMALYSGDNNHEASTSNVVSQVVTTTTTTLSSNVNPQIQGLPVTFTAEVIPTPEGASCHRQAP